MALITSYCGPNHQIDECAKESTLKNRLKSAMRRRRELARRDTTELVRPQGKADGFLVSKTVPFLAVSQDAAEVETLTEEIKFRSTEIQDLQQAVNSAGSLLTD